ncbi:achaete-scute-like protein [Trichonephila clavata]|uniref:Achaete-scute-like protein n=1 Tax=Trichonephila clavata TaxID=2740835 RepID=A0A8X6HWR4_TRICU|nr:achaete-scute-like protein [Trichonephila clavata]
MVGANGAWHHPSGVSRIKGGRLARFSLQCTMADFLWVPQMKVFLPQKDESYRKEGNYKPPKDKPPHLVARRNAQERRRVEAVNSAFAKLRKYVPIENRNRRLSKVMTLQRAIEYINGLEALLRKAPPERDQSQFLNEFLESDVVKKEQSWSTVS